jgi:hypothetical protein
MLMIGAMELHTCDKPLTRATPLKIILFLFLIIKALAYV